MKEFSFLLYSETFISSFTEPTLKIFLCLEFIVGSQKLFNIANISSLSVKLEQ